MLVLAVACDQPSGPPSTQSNQSDILLKPYTSCQFSGGLAPVQIDRLPGTGIRYRTVETSDGERRVSMLDGYRMMLAYPGTSYFANMKVERSDPTQYFSDKEAVINSLRYMVGQSKGVKVEVENRSYNGFDQYALNNPAIEVNGPISTYVLFRDSAQIIVTIYFLNQKAEERKFQSLDEYNALKERVLEDFTKCVS